MVEPYRSAFNASFTEAKYADLLRVLEERTQTPIAFRVAETPCFFPHDLMDRMVQAGTELTAQLLGNADYNRSADAAIPAAWCVPNQGTHPHFMTVDFGLVQDDNGDLQPKLVEMQAFPSLFGYQPVLAKAYMDVYGLDRSLQFLFNGMEEDRYWSLLRETIVGGHDVENVILTEVEPETQKTLPDLLIHAQKLGIQIVDVAKLVKERNRLFYRDPKRGTLVPVERIYNRVIVDEVVRKRIHLPFDYRDDIDVEWAGHPNWYFRISKFSIPHLDHPTVPAAVFLDEWFAGIGHDRLGEDSSQWVLKPLYSFAGKGVQFSPTDADLAGIPVAERCNYLLQRRVHFVPVISTPVGMTQAEIRILYVWPDGKSMTPMTSLVRMGRGLMMGVDHNRDKTWVGGSASFIVSKTAADAQGLR
jgi:hypothetical protein